MRRLIAPVIVTAALVALAANPAGAGLGPVTYSFTPLFGPPGTVVTVSGVAGECDPPSTIGFYLNLGGIPVSAGGTTPNVDGSFSGEVTIPLDAAPGDMVQIGAQCGSLGTQYVLFEVTGAPGTTTPATTAPSTTAPAAVAVNPAFTG